MFSGISNWLSGLGSEGQLAFRCAVNALIGGALGFYVRELYKRWGSSFSNREDFGNLFPMLTASTVVIIFVVKSSLALSLGLVGALSIVRFRTAIKNPEELVYLFFCIGIGVSLGAELRLLTLLAVLIVSGFVVGRHFLTRKSSRHNLLLTVSGEARHFFEGADAGVVSLLRGLTGELTVQRFDLEDGQVQFRATVSISSAEEVAAFMSKLQARLPNFHLSYVNLDNLL